MVLQVVQTTTNQIVILFLDFVWIIVQTIHNVPELTPLIAKWTEEHVLNVRRIVIARCPIGEAHS